MTYKPSLKVKPEVLIEAGVEALNDKLVVSNTITKRNDIAKFFSAAGDTITQRVKGTLPVRQYAPRNDRSQPIITDAYAESTVSITIDVIRPYSAVKLTDEQKDWDFNGGWGDITDLQAETVSQFIENGVMEKILAAPYERVVVAKDTDAAAIKAATEIGQDVYYNMFVEAKKGLRLMRSPYDNLVAVCGVDFEEALLKSNRLVKDQGTGDSALTSATLGTIAGVRVISSTHVPAKEAFLYHSTAFVAFTGVPSIPKSVPFGASASANGWAMRWLMDYDSGYLTDRSIFDTYAGYNYTLDHISVYNGESQYLISPDRYFVRGIRLGLASSGLTEKAPGDGKTDTPGGNANSFLAKAYKQETITTTLPVGEAFPLGGNLKVRATATATRTAGAVSSATVTNTGFNYASVPNVTITGGGGTGATATAVLTGGSVTAINITAGGTGYTSNPTITIDEP